jgi:hypothetical protein
MLLGVAALAAVVFVAVLLFWLSDRRREQFNAALTVAAGASTSSTPSTLTIPTGGGADVNITVNAGGGFLPGQSSTVSSPTTAPTAPTAPTGPTGPTAPAAPAAPTAPTAPTAPVGPGGNNAPVAVPKVSKPTPSADPVPPTQPKTETVVPKQVGSLVEAAAAANAAGGCEKSCCPAYVMPIEGDPLKFTTATKMQSVGQFPASGKDFPHDHYYMKDELRKKVRAADNLPFGSAGPSESYDPRCSFVARVLGGTDNAETNSFFLEHNILSHPDETMGHVCYFPPEIGNVSYDENTCSTANAHLYNKQFNDVVDVEGKFGKGEAIKIVMHDGPEPMSRRPMCQIRFNKDLAERPDGHERMAAYMRFLYNASPEREFWRENTTALFNNNLEEAYKNLRAAKEIEDLRGDLKKQSAATQSLEAERAGFLKDPHKFMNTFMDSRLGVTAKDKTGFDSSLEFAKSAASHIPYSGDNIDLKKGAWGVGKHVALLSETDPAKVLSKWSGWAAPGSSADQDKEKGDRASRLAAHITKSAEFDSVWDRKVDDKETAAEAKRKADKCATILPTGYKERKTADGNSVACTYRDGKSPADCASSFKADCTWANVPDPKKPESCDWALGTTGTGAASKFNCAANGELYGAAGIKTYMNRLDATNKARNVVAPGTSKQLDDYLSAAAETGKFNPGFTRDEGNKCIYKNLSQDGCFAVQSGKCDKPAVVNLVGGGSRKLIEGKTNLASSVVAKPVDKEGVELGCSYANKKFGVPTEYESILEITENPAKTEATCAPNKTVYDVAAKCNTGGGEEMACVTKDANVTRTVTREGRPDRKYLPNITFSAAAPIACETANTSVKNGKCTPNDGYGVFQTSTVYSKADGTPNDFYKLDNPNSRSFKRVDAPPTASVRDNYERKLEISTSNVCGPTSSHEVYNKVGNGNYTLSNGTLSPYQATPCGAGFSVDGSGPYFTRGDNNKFSTASPCGNETTLRNGQCVSTKECTTTTCTQQYNITGGIVTLPNNDKAYMLLNDNKTFQKANCPATDYTCQSNDGVARHRNSSGQCIETPKAGSGCTQEFTRSGVSSSNHYTLVNKTFNPREDLYAKIPGGQPAPLNGDTPYKLNETSKTMQVASLPGCIQSYTKVESRDPQPKINFGDVAYTLKTENGQGVFTSGRCATPTNTTQYTKQWGDSTYYELINSEFQIRNTTQIKQVLNLYEKDTITRPDPVGNRQAYVENVNNRTFARATCPAPDYTCPQTGHHRNSSGTCVETPIPGAICDLSTTTVNVDNGKITCKGMYTLNPSTRQTRIGETEAAYVRSNNQFQRADLPLRPAVITCGDNLHSPSGVCVPKDNLHLVSKNVKYSKEGDTFDSKFYKLHPRDQTHFVSIDPCGFTTTWKGGLCEAKPVIATAETCGTGTEFDLTDRKCKMKKCDTGKYLDSDGTCKNLPAATTAISYGTGTKAGTTPNSCVLKCEQGKLDWGNHCLTVCGDNTEWDGTLARCVVKSSVCATGTQWDTTLNKCVPIASGTRVIAIVTTNSWSQENGNGRWTVHKGGDIHAIWESDVGVWFTKSNSNLNGDVDGVYVAEGYKITFDDRGQRNADLDPADQGGHGVWNINGQSPTRKDVIQKANRYRVTKK